MPWLPIGGGATGPSEIDVKKNGTLIGTRGGVNLIEGTNVTLTVADDSANDEVDVTIAASGGGGGLASARTSRTAGDLSLNSTAWADVPGGPHQVSVAAAAGDVLLVAFSAAGDSQAVEAYLDAATIVTGSPVNYVSGVSGSTARGVQAWTLKISTVTFQGGTVQYVVQAGDIDAGTVTLRLRYRTHTGSAKNMFANATMPMQFSVVNLGA